MSGNVKRIKCTNVERAGVYIRQFHVIEAGGNHKYYCLVSTSMYADDAADFNCALGTNLDISVANSLNTSDIQHKIMFNTWKVLDRNDNTLAS